MGENPVPKEMGLPDRKVVEGLTDKQLQAIELLVQGIRPGVVAHRVGVARETLWRWRQRPEFRRHIELLRYELHASRVDRIWRLVDMSYDVVEEHLEEGDPQVALRLLDLAGGRLTDTSGDALQHEQREHLELPDPAEDGPSDEE